jgi:class 3 adenylate cyclase
LSRQASVAVSTASSTGVTVPRGIAVLCGRLLEREAEAVDRPVEANGDPHPVAIMFCDLVGYTRLSAKLDPEEVRALLEQFLGVFDATSPAESWQRAPEPRGAAPH